jgi:replicative DNA helicase
MTDKRDVNDRAKEGTLPKDPSAETRRAVPVRLVAPDEKRAPSDVCDLPAERGLIGALLWAGSNAPELLRINAVIDIVDRGEMFWDRRCGQAFDAMKRCVEAKAEHDPIAVASNDGGSIENLEKLKAEASTVSERQARVYATAIKSTWARRCAGADARVLMEMAKDPKVAFDELVERGRTAIREMAERAGAWNAKSVDAKASVTQFVEHMEKTLNPAMSTGLEDLDTALNGGLRPGEVSIIGARTSVGKSALAAQIAEHIVTDKKTRGALYVTLEMSHEMFTMRLVSARSGVPLSNLRKRVLTNDQWSSLYDACADFASKGMYFTDSPSQTMAAIYAAAVERQRLLAAKDRQLALVVIDYLNLVKPSAEALKKANREQQMAEISRAQRLMAMELNVHVMGLAQINREAEKSAGRMPQLWHLRESGALEQDADVILILHRERELSGLFKREVPPALTLAKARSDETAAMLLDFNPGKVRFQNWKGDRNFHSFYGKDK